MTTEITESTILTEAAAAANWPRKGEMLTFHSALGWPYAPVQVRHWYVEEAGQPGIPGRHLIVRPVIGRNEVNLTQSTTNFAGAIIPSSAVTVIHGCALGAPTVLLAEDYARLEPSRMNAADFKGFSRDVEKTILNRLHRSE